MHLALSGPSIRRKRHEQRHEHHHPTWKFAVAWLIGGLKLGLPTKIKVYDVLLSGRRNVRLPVLPADPAGMPMGNELDVESTSGALVVPPDCKRR